MDRLLKKIQTDSAFSGTWQPDSGLVLGVSGGPDSVCLLDIFAALAQKYPLKLHIVHINYGLRGADSLKDERFVSNLAANYELPLTILAAGGLSQSVSEDDLRRIRYDFFESERLRLGFDLIAVAHSLDDQAETVLHRLIRGSGLKGLSAMSAKSGRIIRPLLSISRAEIVRYLKNRTLRYRIDKSNRSEQYLRNRIRHKLLPLLEKDFNPSIRRTLAANAVNFSDDNALLDRLSSGYLRRGYAESCRKLLSLDPSMQRRVLIQTIEKVKPGTDIEGQHIHELLKALRSRKNKARNVSFSGLKITFRGDKITIR